MHLHDAYLIGPQQADLPDPDAAAPEVVVHVQPPVPRPAHQHRPPSDIRQHRFTSQYRASKPVHLMPFDAPFPTPFSSSASPVLEPLEHVRVVGLVEGLVGRAGDGEGGHILVLPRGHQALLQTQVARAVLIPCNHKTKTRPS